MSPRKRGAQPGNSNALRHGFYSRNFRSQELKDLDDIDPKEFDHEIALIRVSIRRIFELGNDVDDLKLAMELLNTLGLAAQRVSSMLYKHYITTGNQDTTFMDNLNKAMEELNKKHSIY